MTAAIAVVIPTRGRETRLAFALDGLAEQTVPRDAFEIWVVREEHAPGPHAVGPDGLTVQFETSNNASPAAMRNRGWRATQAPLIAFLDDDCRPSPEWLGQLLAAAEPNASKDGEAILQGRTEPDPNELHLLFGLARTIQIVAPSELYETCNIVYPRRLLERLGGFDETFELPHWGEDTDLGLRARAAGASLRWVDGALVWHAVHPNPLPAAMREAGRRRGFAQLLARHPELRERMFWRTFTKRSHAAIALAAAGAVAGLRARRGGPLISAIAAAPFVWLELANLAGQGGPVTPRRLSRAALHVPVNALVELVETVSTARGAVRFRTPVL